MPILPKKFIISAKKCGYNKALWLDKKTPYLFVELDNIISSRSAANLKIEAVQTAQGIKIGLIIKKTIERPIFLCFGIAKSKGQQIILPSITLEKGVHAKIFAHCSFPMAKNVLHKMNAVIKLKSNAELLYEERHYHGELFGTTVLADFKITLNRGARLKTDFILNQGTVGNLNVNLEAILGRQSICEVITKVIEKGKKDHLYLNDRLILKGQGARGLIKIRAAAVNGGTVMGRGETIALAKDSRGHIDCQEIIVGDSSVAKAIPIVDVRHPEARVTHEASVGKINQSALETLMTRGLTEKQAIDFIIRGKVN